KGALVSHSQSAYRRSVRLGARNEGWPHHREPSARAGRAGFLKRSRKRGENTFQLSAKYAMVALLFARRPSGTSCNVIVRRCARTVRIIADVGTTYLSILRRSSQPLIQMSSM